MKLLIFGIIFLILIAGFYFLYITFSNPKKPISQTQAEKQKEEIDLQRIINSHENLYSADFEFNKNNDTFTFIGSGTVKGDMPLYDQIKPELLPETMAIRVRQVDKSNLLITQGWQLLFLEALRPLESPEGIYRFKIFGKYLPGSVIYLYNQEGKQVWVGSIN